MDAMLLAFLPVAALLAIAPGPSTATVVRSALRGGNRAALMTTLGNEVGVVAWALAAAVGIATVVATSAAAFTAVKLAGAVVLVVMGLQSLLRRAHVAEEHARTPVTPRAAFRDGALTSVTNPKLAVFYVALFPQFVPAGESVLVATLLMCALLVAIDLAYLSALALVVTRARRAIVEGRWAVHVERVTGAVLVGLGVRLASARH